MVSIPLIENSIMAYLHNFVHLEEHAALVKVKKTQANKDKLDAKHRRKG